MWYAKRNDVVQSMFGIPAGELGIANLHHWFVFFAPQYVSITPRQWQNVHATWKFRWTDATYFDIGDWSVPSLLKKVLLVSFMLHGVCIFVLNHSSRADATNLLVTEKLLVGRKDGGAEFRAQQIFA